MFSALGAILIYSKYGFKAAIWFAIIFGVLETTDYLAERYTGSTIIEYVIDRLTFPSG